MLTRIVVRGKEGVLQFGIRRVRGDWHIFVPKGNPPNGRFTKHQWTLLGKSQQEGDGILKLGWTDVSVKISDQDGEVPTPSHPLDYLCRWNHEMGQLASIPNGATALRKLNIRTTAGNEIGSGLDRGSCGESSNGTTEEDDRLWTLLQESVLLKETIKEALS